MTSSENVLENLEELFCVHAICTEPWAVEGKSLKVVMVPFTGDAKGRFFNGNIIGSGCDTQKFQKNGEGALSARYMLEGTDYTGQKCRIFIENSVCDDKGWHPKIVTDSKALSCFEDLPVSATVTGVSDGVMVRIFCDKKYL